MNLQYPLDENFVSFKYVDILIYHKQHKYILVGRNAQETQFSLILIKKAKHNEPCRRLYEILTPIDGTFSEEDLYLEIAKYVKKPEDNQKIQTLGILGFVRFCQGYYLVYIQEKDKIAKIGRHKINLIKKTEILPLFESTNNKTWSDEKKYLQLFKAYKLQNCYFSYSYDVTNPLSINMSRNSVQLFHNDITQHNKKEEDQSYYGSDKSIKESCEIFLWNYNLLKEFNMSVRKKWILPIVHGYCKQINIKVRGTIFNVIILSRRSRHHAGTRYIKRGIDSYGFVANFVETQQIVVNQSTSQDSKPVCSSYIGVRGSAPVYWMQQPNFLKAKPPIEMVKSDPLHYSTRKHFHDLVTRYGQVIYCFNLMKMVEKTPREIILCREFSNAVDFINKNDLPQDHHIHYIHFDYKANQKVVDKQLFIDKMHCMIYHCIMKMGVFVCLNSSRLDHSQYVEFQNGVIRTNCVDCLDRTNSFQQLMGETALSIQICKLLKQDINLDVCNDEESVFKQYRALYEEMGDLISIQYGSSLAHKQKVNESSGKRFQFLTSITRHYNNNFNDSARQQQIDVFLGNCYPQKQKIWDEKPDITLFPSRDIRRYARKGWHEEAYKNFQKINRLEMFEKLQKPQLLQKFFNVNHECRWTPNKKELESLFTMNIVEKILDVKQRSDVLTYCVQPNLKLSKKVWRALNPKSKTLCKLEIKINRPYYLNTYSHSHEHIVTKTPALRKVSDDKPQSDDQDNSTIIFRDPVDGPMQKVTDLDISMLIQTDYFKLPEKELDNEDINTIANYRNKCLINDDMIWDDLALMNAVSNVKPEGSMFGNPVTEHDWKSMENNIASGNFIWGNNLHQSQFHLGSTPNLRRGIESNISNNLSKDLDKSLMKKKPSLNANLSFKKIKILP